MELGRVWSLDDLVEVYEQHQRRTRGLREKTLGNYGRHVRAFVRDALGEDPVDLSRLTAADVIEFVAAMAVRWSPASMKGVRTALRSFLRFLQVGGVCDVRLEAAIPKVASWRLSSLPRRLSDGQLTRVLASLEVSATPCGPRDRAIVWCLASLGLRPGEVAGLRLDDIDWRAGTLEIASRKNRRGAVLPLPEVAGGAIADYLAGHRPDSDVRHVFVQHVGPRRGQPIGATAVSEVVSRALRRAEVDAPMAGGYVLRHTVASRMVGQGVSLKEVADFLGHRDLDTTAIYTKVDLPALREVAAPWPQVSR